jgi:hypothetical protein
MRQRTSSGDALWTRSSERPVTRERALVSAMLELADTMVTDYEVVDFLYRLCDQAVRIVDADAAGVLLAGERGELEVAAATTLDIRRLERVEATSGEGPCAHAHRTGETVEEDDLACGGQRWPRFAEAATDLGFRSVHARPLCLRGSPIGALSVFRRDAGGFTPDDAEVLGGLADMATIGIVTNRAIAEAEDQVLILRQALRRRAVVDQATAVLADRLGIDHGEAFQRLRHHARAHNDRLRDLATRVLAGEVDTDALR